MAKSKQGWFLPLIALMFILWLFTKPGEHTATHPPAAPSPPSALSYSPSPAVLLPEQTANAEEFVNADRLNVRDRPDGKVVSKVNRGDKVRIYERTQSLVWARISTDGSSARWVSAASLCDSPGCYDPRASTAMAPVLRPEPKPRQAPMGREYSCSCDGGNVCIGPRGGRYCITSGGYKKYGR